MISAVLLAVALAQGQQPPPAGRPVPQGRAATKDTARPDSATRRAGHRAPVTAALAASAFHDAATRSLFEKARRTRVTQDSTLRNYDAITRQRMSVDLGIGKVGREHLFYRQESAARVQWQHDVGAYIDVTGARVGIPMAPKQAEIDNLLSDVSRMSAIPYFPGYEALWVGGDGAAARAEANERDIVNPLAIGSEAYYTYSLRDSVRFKLQDGSVISLREMEIRPRQPKWNLAVGSLWFDDKGQLVKAAYRLSTPIDMWSAIDDAEDGKSGVPTAVKGFFSPMRAQITGVAIEYSLHGQHWLPRMRSMEGNAEVLFARVPLQIDQRFEYRTVNGPDTLPRIDSLKLPIRTAVRSSNDSAAQEGRQIDTTRRVPVGPITIGVRSGTDSARQRRADSIRTANRDRRDTRDKRLEAVADSIERGLPATGLAPGSAAARECDSTGVRTVYLRRFATGMPVAARIPCDLNKLIHSPDLPPSIYDPGEEVFDTKDRDEMFAQALSMAAQAPVSFGALPPASVTWGLPMTRFNRVEGLSTGLSVEQQLGGGYTFGGTARFGLADRDPNVELTAARTNLTKTVRLTGYHHLVSASDWGNPLSFGSSFSALFFGKDEGFYYRSTGAELTWTRGQMSRFEWRLFADDERTAPTETSFAVFRRTTTDSFPNIVADEGTYFGGGLHAVHNHGLDPRGFRTFTDFRAEVAKRDSVYGRAAGELTLSNGLPFKTAVGLTLSAGSSVGPLPTQRRWYLGGTQTVRGQDPEIAQGGNAFWLTRLELGRDNPGHRSSLFGDMGWAGDRDHLETIGIPMSGVGYGESMFDGIFRVDLSYGLHPKRQLRFDVYLEARF